MAMWDERNCQSFETAARGFKSWFSRLRPRCSNRDATVQNKANEFNFKHTNTVCLLLCNDGCVEDVVIHAKKLNLFAFVLVLQPDKQYPVVP